MNEMSSGEARRVLLARALVTNPRALVLDEPTTGLDVVGRHRFMERVRSIARDGTTLILITHHVEEIIPEIDRVILLQERPHRRRWRETRHVDGAHTSATPSTARMQVESATGISMRGPARADITRRDE